MPKERASLWGQHLPKYCTESLYHCVGQTCLIFAGVRGWGVVLFLNFPFTRKEQIYPSSVNHLNRASMAVQAQAPRNYTLTCREHWRHRDRRKAWFHVSHLIQPWPQSSQMLQQELTLPFDFQGEEPSPETPAIELNL